MSIQMTVPMNPAQMTYCIEGFLFLCVFALMLPVLLAHTPVRQEVYVLCMYHFVNNMSPIDVAE